MSESNLKLYGTKAWNIQVDSVSINQDDRGVLTGSVTYEAAVKLGESGSGLPAFPGGAKKGGEFPYNELFGVDMTFHRRSCSMRPGFALITAYYVGLDEEDAPEGKSQIRSEWVCNTQASPIETHPNYASKMRVHAVEENGLFVAFPANAPENLGGVTDFLEPAATLRISWVEKYNKGELEKWTKKIGKITDVPNFANFDLDLGNRDFLLSSFNYSFYAKSTDGEEEKYQECSLELQMSQENGWNQLIYKEAE